MLVVITGDVSVWSLFIIRNGATFKIAKPTAMKAIVSWLLVRLGIIFPLKGNRGVLKAVDTIGNYSK